MQTIERTLVCRRCGAEWDGAFSFCPRCGASLGSPGRDEAPPRGLARRAQHALVPAVAICGLVAICLAALWWYGPARATTAPPTPAPSPVVVFVPAPTVTPAPTSTPLPTPTSIPTPTVVPTPTIVPTPTPPPFRTMAFVVPPTRAYTLTLDDVRTGDVIEGTFSAQGGHGDVDFQLRSPNGGVLASASRSTGQFEFHALARQDGYYVLWFGNTFSLVTSKTVSLKLRDYPAS